MIELASIDKYVLRETFEIAKTLAASRLELLRRGIKPMNSVEYKIWVEDVAKELGDD